MMRATGQAFVGENSFQTSSPYGSQQLPSILAKRPSFNAEVSEWVPISTQSMIPWVPDVFVTRLSPPVTSNLAPVPVGNSHPAIYSTEKVFKCDQPPSMSRKEDEWSLVKKLVGGICMISDDFFKATSEESMIRSHFVCAKKAAS